MKWLLIKLIGFYCNLSSQFFPQHSGKLAMKLFSIPRKGWINKEQQEFLDTSFREELNCDEDTLMSYRWVGKGPTLLLVHGWESNTSRWKNLIQLLKKLDFNVVALDAPAHGNSGSYFFNVHLYSKFITILINKFQPVYVVAHSVGAMAACKAMSEQKYTPKKLVLIGAPSKYEDIILRYTNMMGYNKKVRSNLSSRLSEIFRTTLQNVNTATYAKNIEIPILVCHDANDDIIPYNDALEITRECTKSKLFTTENMGHSLNNEVVNEEILAFVSN